MVCGSSTLAMILISQHLSVMRKIWLFPHSRACFAMVLVEVLMDCYRRFLDTRRNSQRKWFETDSQRMTINIPKILEKIKWLFELNQNQMWNLHNANIPMHEMVINNPKLMAFFIIIIVVQNTANIKMRRTNSNSINGSNNHLLIYSKQIVWSIICFFEEYVENRAYNESPDHL